MRLAIKNKVEDCTEVIAWLGVLYSSVYELF